MLFSRCSTRGCGRQTRADRNAACPIVASAAARPASGDPGVSRRDLLGASAAAALAAPLAAPKQAGAVGFQKEMKKRKLTPEDFTLQEASGLGVYDLEAGRGKEVKPGDKVTVHFDAMYRGIDAVSSRYARTLGGNRTIAEPLEFVAGSYVEGSSIKMTEGGGGGLFSGSPGPQPPQAISKAVLGMKAGGRRAVLVNQPELGYPKGNQEIPPGATFELRIELLNVISK